MKDKLLTPMYVYEHMEVGDEIIFRNTLNRYKVISKKLIPNVIMGYLAGSIVQKVKLLKLENISDCELKGEVIAFCSHDINKKITGDYIGHEYPISDNWESFLFMDKDVYDNNMKQSYIDYLKSIIETQSKHINNLEQANKPI